MLSRVTKIIRKLLKFIDWYHNSEVSSVKNIDQKYTCYISRRYGQFGNNFLQVVSALKYAEMYNIDSIYITALNNTKMKGVESLSRSKIKYGLPLRRRVIYGSYYNDRIPENIYSLTENQKNTLTYIFKGLNINEKEASEDLTIHIRSGDVFNEHPHPDYVQPSLSYYKIAIEKLLSPGGKVKLVYENDNNPVIGELRYLLAKKNIPYANVNIDIEETLKVLMNANKLVASYGSFLVPSIILSRNLKKIVYVSDDKYIQKALTNRTDIEKWSVKFENYIQRGEWKNTGCQRSLMLTHSDIVMIGPIL